MHPAPDDPPRPPEDDAWFRPVWDDGQDEPVDSALCGRPTDSRSDGARPLARLEPAALLAPLASAADALARLEAKVEMAPPQVAEGLVARMAFHEAAGWLAYRGTWVHPLDLALRDAGLAGAREMPNTAGHLWDEMELAERLEAEEATRTALHLARLLRRGARGRGLPLMEPTKAIAALQPLGASGLDAIRLAQWQARASERGTDPRSTPLLGAALVAEDWMYTGISDLPASVQALAAAAAWLTHAGWVRTVPLPFWAAAPSIAQGEPDLLPGLRSDAAGRLGFAGTPPWPSVFLAMVAEAAQAALRELDRLLAAAATGAALVQDLDKRSQLGAATQAVLRLPAITPKGLARQLDITPQAALRLLARLTDAGVIREVTGRKSFRAFAVDGTGRRRRLAL
jgi:DNA-binding MarR family transcriptional regulator